MPAAYQPGEGWMYGCGIDMAAFLVERASGQRLDANLREHVFAPVGVPPSDISFFPKREGLAARVPDRNPDDPEGKGLATLVGLDMDDGGDVCYGGHGGHGAHATARAYVAVLESILKNGGRVLGRDMIIDPKNGVCGFVSPVLHTPTDVALAGRLRAAFRTNLGPVLQGMSPK
ncbi:hypothetical protein EV715DRAFT_288405 [Schizophyllum commune]